nr:hypothetical protein B0A51_01182 [Rachicladosporium sp. CCFEE 5018]
MKTVTAITLGATLFTTLATAQQQYQIDPTSVNITLRNNWCGNEVAQCPLICSQVTGSLTITSNTCDAQSLTYSCVCSDGTSPNITEYTQTLPFFICQEWGNQCSSNCGTDNTCVAACRQNHPCGAQSPIRANTSTLTSTMSSTMSGSSTGAAASVTGGETVYSGFAGASASQTSGGGAAAASASATGASSAGTRVVAMQFGQSAGFLALGAAFFGGFAFLL